jgi:hypothetical protein
MESSPQRSELLFCPIRKIFIKPLPEEVVRQRLIEKMLTSWGYSKEKIVVEKSLNELLIEKHSGRRPPERRLDIVCFGPFGKPLLVVECKDEKISKAAFRQLLGYNYFIRAPFVGLCTRDLLQVFRIEGASLKLLEIEPTYEQLLLLS